MIEMMEHAALSIAMGQGNEKLKAQADFVTHSVNGMVLPMLPNECIQVT